MLPGHEQCREILNDNSHRRSTCVNALWEKTSSEERHMCLSISSCAISKQLFFRDTTFCQLGHCFDVSRRFSEFLLRGCCAGVFPCCLMIVSCLRVFSLLFAFCYSSFASTRLFPSIFVPSTVCLLARLKAVTCGFIRS